MEENIKDPIWKRIVIILLGIFLLLLILSYFIASYALFPIFETLFESKIAKNETIVLDNLSIVFTNNTFEKLQKIYDRDLSVEIAACLIGKADNDYIINYIYEPNIIEQSVNKVVFSQCSTDTIILLHSHPYKKCIASEQDLITLSNSKENNPKTIMVIMCENNRFSVYK